MSNLWAERQRRTNELVRAVSGWMLYQPNVTADQLYGLCKLTWITNSFDVNNRAYIASTKVPALSSVFAKDYTEYSLQEIANDASSLLGESSRELIVGHTGFTNFYKAYRNSARPWFEANQVKIAKLFRRAFELSSDQEGESLMEDLATLPSVPKAKSQSVSMAPESILTPALFSLDKRMRFPLINGNKGVKSVLKALGAHRLTLGGKYAKLITLYGQGGIQDAADLDQIGHDLPSFISVGGVDANRRLLEQRPVDGKPLPAKDERDTLSLISSQTLERRRLHNALTNLLLSRLSRFGLREGCNDSALFDVLVKDFDSKGHDLMVEAKSSADDAHIRMAIGQLFDYWYRLTGGSKPKYLAVYLPEQPRQYTVDFLHWLKIGVLWRDRDNLFTCTTWLREIADFRSCT